MKVSDCCNYNSTPFHTHQICGSFLIFLFFFDLLIFLCFMYENSVKVSWVEKINYSNHSIKEKGGETHL